MDFFSNAFQVLDVNCLKNEQTRKKGFIGLTKQKKGLHFWQIIVFLFFDLQVLHNMLKGGVCFKSTYTLATLNKCNRLFHHWFNVLDVFLISNFVMGAISMQAHFQRRFLGAVIAPPPFLDIGADYIYNYKYIYTYIYTMLLL